MIQKPIPDYLLPDNSTSDSQGTLEVSGVNLCDVAEQYGTPVIVYDEDHIRARLKEAKDGFDLVAYASKAFTCKSLCKIVQEEGLSLDVASLGEMIVALKAGVDPAKLVFHGNNRSFKELASAIEYGVGKIVLDSYQDIFNLESLLSSGIGGKRLNVLLRLTPGVEANTHQYVKTGQEDSKFGFPLMSKELSSVIEKLLKSKELNLLGIHFHIGSQVFKLDSYEAAIQAVAEFLSKYELEELCVGGGLGVPYVTGDPVIKISDWALAIKKYASENLSADIKISAEPGRAIVASAAVTVYKIGVIKKIDSVRTYVAVDGGMFDNPRPMIYGSKYEAFLPRAFRDERTEKVTVVGKHCESGDVLVKDAYLPGDYTVGDYLGIPVTGAYTFSMASNYNKMPRPAVVFVRQGEVYPVIRRETIDDLLLTDLG
jgi:diaminopimelate decarboxylase